MASGGSGQGQGGGGESGSWREDDERNSQGEWPSGDSREESEDDIDTSDDDSEPEVERENVPENAFESKIKSSRPSELQFGGQRNYDGASTSANSGKSSLLENRGGQPVAFKLPVPAGDDGDVANVHKEGSDRPPANIEAAQQRTNIDTSLNTATGTSNRAVTGAASTETIRRLNLGARTWTVDSGRSRQQFMRELWIRPQPYRPRCFNWVSAFITLFHPESNLHTWRRCSCCHCASRIPDICIACGNYLCQRSPHCSDHHDCAALQQPARLGRYLPARAFVEYNPHRHVWCAECRGLIDYRMDRYEVCVRCRRPLCSNEVCGNNHNCQNRAFEGHERRDRAFNDDPYL